MKIRYKIESVVEMNFKKLIAKIINLIFKYILSSYFIDSNPIISSTFHALIYFFINHFSFSLPVFFSKYFIQTKNVTSYIGK